MVATGLLSIFFVGSVAAASASSCEVDVAADYSANVQADAQVHQVSLLQNSLHLKQANIDRSVQVQTNGAMGPSTVRLVDSGGAVVNGHTGLLQLEVSGVWKYVCNDGFDMNSNGANVNVACRELGYAFGIYSEGVAPVPNFYDEIECTGAESRLVDCPRIHGHNCGPDEAVTLTCAGEPPTARLVDGGGRVVNRNTGLLQLRVSGVWKYVCDDHFNSNNNGANVACRELGYASGTLSDGVAPVANFYDDIVCTGAENRLADCPRIHGHNCGTFEAVTLTCASVKKVLEREAKMEAEMAKMEAEIEELEAFAPGPGYCQPWGNSGGDLCREHPTRVACDYVDTNNYYLPSACDASCARQKCISDSLCAGYTYSLDKNAFKLKSKITKVDGGSDYRCFQKVA